MPKIKILNLIILIILVTFLGILFSKNITRNDNNKGLESANNNRMESNIELKLNYKYGGKKLL